jgi:rhomboid-like protein
MVALILWLNILVFVLWHIPSEPLTAFMIQHFLVSWNSVAEGRVWTLLGSEFSHVEFWHLFLNMFVLNSFGRFLEAVLGARRFLRFYLSAAIVASLGHCLVSAFLLGAPDQPAVGASGAISGLILVFALLFPRERILLFGFVPVPAIFGALFAVGLDIWGLVAQARGGGLPIGHGAHLGGAVAGFVYYWFFLRRKRRPRVEVIPF